MNVYGLETKRIVYSGQIEQLLKDLASDDPRRRPLEDSQRTLVTVAEQLSGSNGHIEDTMLEQSIVRALEQARLAIQGARRLVPPPEQGLSAPSVEWPKFDAIMVDIAELMTQSGDEVTPAMQRTYGILREFQQKLNRQPLVTQAERAPSDLSLKKCLQAARALREQLYAPEPDALAVTAVPETVPVATTAPVPSPAMIDSTQVQSRVNVLRETITNGLSELPTSYSRRLELQRQLKQLDRHAALEPSATPEDWRNLEEQLVGLQQELVQARDTVVPAVMPPASDQLLTERKMHIRKFLVLLRQRENLTTELTNTPWWGWLKRNSINVDLAQVQQRIDHYLNVQPYLRIISHTPRVDLNTPAGRELERAALAVQLTTQAASFERPDTVGKYVATHRADLKQDLLQRTLPENPETNYQFWLERRRIHMRQKPVWFGVSKWEEQKSEIEKKLEEYRVRMRAAS